MRLPPSRPSCPGSFAESVTEAQKLAQPDDFDFLHRIGESYATLRRYAPEFLCRARCGRARRQNVLDAIEVLRGMNTDNARKLPADAPTGFTAALAETGDDRRRHRPALLRTVRAVRVEELPALGRHLGAGFTPVQGLRGLPGTAREVHQPKQSSELPLAVATDCEQYLHERLTLLEAQLATVNRMAAANDLPDAIITESGFEDHAAGCGGARHRAGADRPDSHGPAARQDHRTAARSR